MNCSFNVSGLSSVGNIIKMELEVLFQLQKHFPSSPASVLQVEVLLFLFCCFCSLVTADSRHSLNLLLLLLHPSASSLKAVAVRIHV